MNTPHPLIADVREHRNLAQDHAREAGVMAQVYICPVEVFIDGFCRPQHDRHCADRRWHLHMMNFNENYLAEIAARQAAKRAAGIGPEGRCPA